MDKSPLLILLFALLFTAPAAAQSEILLMSPSDIEITAGSSAQDRLAQLERAYQDVRLGPKRTGVAASALVIWGGFGATFAGMLNNSCWSSAEQHCRTTAGNTLLGVGSAIIGAGIAGLVVSSIRLHRGKEDRNRLRWEMMALERGLPQL
jgi:hypothetical protein